MPVSVQVNHRPIGRIGRSRERHVGEGAIERITDIHQSPFQRGGIAQDGIADVSTLEQIPVDTVKLKDERGIRLVNRPAASGITRLVPKKKTWSGELPETGRCT